MDSRNSKKLANINEISQFETAIAAIDRTRYDIEKRSEHAYVLIPSQGSRIRLPQGKNIGLTFLAIMHGNEIGGVRVLTDVLAFLNISQWSPSLPIAFVLCNYRAAAEDVRFLDRDLNRSFGMKNNSTWEGSRALELEDILTATAYMVDLHQTTEVAESPFFIFPYTPHAFALAQGLDEHLPIVTHWGQPFSQEGRCSDDYINSLGGTGLTIELGQNGVSAFKSGAGFKVCLKAMAVAEHLLSGKNLPKILNEPEVYTWNEIIPWTEERTQLNPGWYNFKIATSGEILGYCGKEQVPIVAGATGPVLFPKYQTTPEKPKVPGELVRILKRISVHDLGKSNQ